MEKTGYTLHSLAKKVRLLILDVDGVLTDGTIYIDYNGNHSMAFNVRDGHGIKMLLNEGLDVAIISARDVEAIKVRAGELGIRDVFLGCHDKVSAYSSLKEKYSLKDSEIAFMGDDMVDLGVMRYVGFSITVADAEDYIKERALFVTNKSGGRGAVREVAEFILTSKGVFGRVLDAYDRV